MDTRTQSTSIRRLPIHPVLIVIIGIFLLSSLVMIDQFPKVWIDTAWTCMAPYNLVHHGSLANPMRPLHGLEEHLLAPYIVQRVLLAVVYEIFGFGLIQSRLLSIFAGLLLVVITYSFSLRYFGRRVALLAAFLLVTDSVFFLTSRSIRADIFLSLFSTTGIFALILAFESKKKKFLIFSGLFFGVSLYTHPNSILVLLPALIFFFKRWNSRFVFLPLIWYFVLALLFSFAPYVIYVFVSDYGNDFQNFLGQIGGLSTYSNRSFRSDIILELSRYQNYIIFPARFLIFVTQFLVLIFSLVSKNRIVRYLRLHVIAFLLLLPVWNPWNPTVRYFVAVIPSMSILISVAFFSVYNNANPGRFNNNRDWLRFKALALVLLAAYSLNQMAGNSIVLWRHRHYDYFGLIERIRRTVPPEAKVWAPASFWIGLHENQFLSELTPEENLRAYQPEFVILYDPATWGTESPTIGRRIEPNRFSQRRTQLMQDVCRERGKCIDRIDDLVYGTLEVYRLDWQTDR